MFRNVLLAALCTVPFAVSAEPRPAEIVAGEIRPGWQMKNGARMAAIHLQLQPEWKTYWRSPGEAGIPPEFDWTGSRNVRSVRFHWPRPEVFETNGMRTIGYHRQLILPVEVMPIDPSKPIHLRADMELGLCRNICIPAEMDLQADLSGAGGDDTLIDAALRAQPASAAKAGVSRIACSVEPIPDGLRVTARIDLPPQGAEEIVVLEPADQSIWTSESDTRRDGGQLVSTVEMVAASGAPFVLDRSAMTVTVLGDGRAVEIRGCPAG